MRAMCDGILCGKDRTELGLLDFVKLWNLRASLQDVGNDNCLYQYSERTTCLGNAYDTF